jgi:hypothetical protein
MKARSLIAIGEALMVPGPLPRHPDEPRPIVWMAPLSQPFAVSEGQGGRLPPIWVGLGLAWLDWLGTVDAVRHPPITIAASSRQADRTNLDIAVSPQRLGDRILRF